ncbi:hypothetical protein DFJ74DRAFT_675324 [Hyaloraphidium curvatum]|nr:hypothetical protein DFJ74DRAFT_675324 [Hyaloraphidium curvatum]
MGVRLVAVIKENKPLEIAGFREFWPEPLELFLDESKAFYRDVAGGELNKASFFSLFGSSLRQNAARAESKGYSGNMKGEGFILGGIGVYDKDKGVVYSYAEKEFGDHAPLEDLLAAVRSVAPKPSA